MPWNFWADVTRITLYVPLPISIVIALVFIWQGMPRNLAPYAQTTLEGAKQTIAERAGRLAGGIKVLAIRQRLLHRFGAANQTVIGPLGPAIMTQVLAAAPGASEAAG